MTISKDQLSYPITKKFIITGASGAGKSTLIQELENRGFDCIHEVAREVIKTEQARDGMGMPWKDVEVFAKLVLQRSKQLLNVNCQALFSDRSVIDYFAYLTHYGKTVFDELVEFPYAQHYHKTVFFALPWKEIYVNDAQRPETFEAQIPLSGQLHETYLKMGFDIKVLPFSSVDDRADFVLDAINAY